MNVTSGISSQLQDQFLTLLVTQLQNQDPIEPVKQENFIAQLAQFSTVEGLESLNVQFEDMLRSQEIFAGFDLVGKGVKYVDPASGEIAKGTVEEAFVDGGALMATISGQTVSIGQIIGVTEPV